MARKKVERQFTTPERRRNIFNDIIDEYRRKDEATEEFVSLYQFFNLTRNGLLYCLEEMYEYYNNCILIGEEIDETAVNDVDQEKEDHRAKLTIVMDVLKEINTASKALLAVLEQLTPGTVDVISDTCIRGGYNFLKAEELPFYRSSPSQKPQPKTEALWYLRLKDLVDITEEDPTDPEQSSCLYYLKSFKEEKPGLTLEYAQGMSCTPEEELAAMCIQFGRQIRQEKEEEAKKANKKSPTLRIEEKETALYRAIFAAEYGKDAAAGGQVGKAIIKNVKLMMKEDRVMVDGAWADFIREIREKALTQK